MWKDRITKDMEFTDEEIGEIRIIDNFLPPPEHLIFKEDSVKITLSLTSKVVHYFKEQAALHHTQYQKMIRALLDEYVLRCMAAEYKSKKHKSPLKTSGLKRKSDRKRGRV